MLLAFPRAARSETGVSKLGFMQLMVTENARSIDKVRAAHDGHAYHETWAVRSALELLAPDTTLAAIALEGFPVEDEEELPSAAIEIADLVRYHGTDQIATASLVEIVQFKYSIARSDTAVRAADVVSTLRKFAQSEAGFRERHAHSLIDRVVRYSFVTNRPIHPNLTAALAALRAGHQADGDVGRQAHQLATAVSGLGEAHIAGFMDRLALAGAHGSLSQANQSVRRLLADWSEPGDPESKIRLLRLRALVREKVSTAGEANKLINRVSVLAELDIDHESVLYPTPDAFPPVTHVVARPFVDAVVAAVADNVAPLLVHAAGGMGKTVLLEAVRRALEQSDFVISFDGFGAGRWRDPADGRHRAERTLVHLANLLAGQGLCDLLLPITDETTLLRAFRGRLEQAAAAARRLIKNARIVVILDAIDHAAMQARDTNGRSFAHLLLQSLSVNPIAGVAIVASCRTERVDLSIGTATCRLLEVPPFSDTEARELVLARDPTATGDEIAALGTRSGQNPRCLDALLTAGRPYDIAGPNMEPSTILDSLLAERIEAAKGAARSRGANDRDIQLILGGLAILPPPVPLEELAAAHGMHVAQTEGFAADLFPLLERTAHGLMFRDEPTETFIRKLSATNTAGREQVVEHLSNRQQTSNYAARALPAVLTALKRTEALVLLAFDRRVPATAGKVGEREIRLVRILAALQGCAVEGRNDDLIRLLLEAAQVASGHARADRFLYDHPDLVAISNDAEAVRRLFATKSGWPGGRHAALAVSYALLDDVAEAKRNSQRAIDWHNWSVGRQASGGFNRTAVQGAFDVLGFAYVESLGGGGSRITEWLNRGSEGEAFSTFSEMFDLLERHAISLPNLERTRRALFKSVVRCRLKSRPLLAAALTYSDGDARRDCQLLERLSAITASAPERSDYDERRRTYTPHDAILAAVAKAIALKLPKQAATILAQVQPSRVSVHDFDSYWLGDDDVQRATIAAGLRAVVHRRKVSLIDLAPREVVAAIAPSILKRGPAAFERALEVLLKDAPTGQKGHKRRRKPKLDYELRERTQRAITHRIRPLMPYAHFVSEMATSATPSIVLQAAIDRLITDTEKTSDYPYQDGKAYLARTAFQVVFRVADAIGAVDAVTADRLAAWLPTAPGMFAVGLSRIVIRLSRNPVGQEAVIKLASHVATLIATDTDIASRIEAYGTLARGVWRVSRNEATAYFQRGLDIADAMGSNDFDRTNSLLAIASGYTGSPLNPKATHQLARIFELNFSDVSKFPWKEFGEAMARTSGLGALAIVARLDDRDQAALRYSLPPLLSAMVIHGQLSADIALCLVGLGEPRETWGWNLGTFAETVVPLLPRRKHEWAFDVLLIELDRMYLAEPWRETLSRLHALGTKLLPAKSLSLARLNALMAELPQPESHESRSTLASSAADSTAQGIDFTDVTAIEVAAASGVDDDREWRSIQVLNELTRQPKTPDERRAFLDAICAANGITLSDKLRALEDVVPEWAVHSASLKDYLPQIGKKLVAKHADELVGSSWEVDYSWRRLSSTFKLTAAAFVPIVMAALDSTAAEVSGDGWLTLARFLAPEVAPSALGRGLERFLDQSGSAIPDEVGDGPWSEKFAVPDDTTAVTARLVWMRLGCPEADQRWRAAHAVRRFAACGQHDIVNALVGLFDTDTAEPFSSATLPFYALHARLWLLIALARIAKDQPALVAVHREFLERVALGNPFPHVAMQAFARAALDTVIGILEVREAVELRAKLATVNVSPFAQSQKSGQPSGLYVSRPASHPEPPNSFHLDYDFNKHFVSELAEAFGLPGWEIQDRINDIVRGWHATITGMYTCPRISSHDYNRGSWSSVAPPDVDRYGGFLGWHALLVVAGQLLKTRPLQRHAWPENPWADFLKHAQLSRSDGLWLSDLTDFVPVDMRRALAMPKNGVRENRLRDRNLLMPILGLKDGQVCPDDLVVSGYWTLPDDVNVTLRTVLCDPTYATALAFAVITGDPFFRWLPHDTNDIERQMRKRSEDIYPWLNYVENAEQRLDQHDPYASPTALRRESPAECVAAVLRISKRDTVGRFWGGTGGPDVFQAQAWGRVGGYGERSWNKSGHRIQARTSNLRDFLREQKKVLVGLISARQFLRDKENRTGDNAFVHRTLAFIVDRNLHVHMPVRIPSRVQQAISALDKYHRSELDARLEAILLSQMSKPRR